MADHTRRWLPGRAAQPLIAGLTLAAATFMSITSPVPVAGAAETATPPAASTVATPPTSTPILVTRTTLVHVVCTTTSDPLSPPFPPAPPVLTSVLVQTRAPLSVPFGGTYQLTNVKMTFVLGTGPPGFLPGLVGIGVPGPSHTPSTFLGNLTDPRPAVGTNVLTRGPFTPLDVLGQVGQSIDVGFGKISVSFYLPGSGIPTFGIPTTTITYGCTPVAGTPPIATTVIGPPPGGAPPTDHVAIAVRDQTTGAIVYQAAAFVTSGNFYAPSTPPPYPTTSDQLYGTATFPGPDGGQATLSLAYSVHYLDTPPGDFYSVPLVVLSLSDPVAGVYVHAASDGIGNVLRTGFRPEDYSGIASGHLLTNGDPVVVLWEVRDLI